jgi:hypothetical protein
MTIILFVGLVGVNKEGVQWKEHCIVQILRRATTATSIKKKGAEQGIA